MTVGTGQESREGDEAAGTGRMALMVPSAPPGSPVPTGPEAPIMEVLRTMRAMRRLKPDPVPRELLEQLVEAATWAPSASNQQLYSYIVVTDRAQMARLGALWREVKRKYLALTARLDPAVFTDPDMLPVGEAVEYQAEHFDETPAVIAVCYAQSPAPRDPRLIAGIIRDIGMTTLRGVGGARMAAVVGASSSFPGVQNLLLTARALGLAANVTIWHFFAENEFKQALGVPKDVTIYALIPVGWPAGNFGPVRRRPVADVVHWDRW